MPLLLEEEQWLKTLRETETGAATYIAIEVAGQKNFEKNLVQECIDCDGQNCFSVGRCTGLRHSVSRRDYLSVGYEFLCFGFAKN